MLISSKSLTLYQLYSGTEVETIKNPRVIRFFVGTMVGSKHINDYLSNRKEIQIVRSGKYGWKNLMKFVNFMNQYYYDKNGHRVKSTLELPTLKKGYNSQWVKTCLEKEIRYAVQHDYHMRTVNGLTQLQVKRVFRLLWSMEAINFYGLTMKF